MGDRAIQREGQSDWFDLKPSRARTVVLQALARAAIDSAFEKWAGAAPAWRAIEWCIVRDPLVGSPLAESGAIRALYYDGARSIDQPDAAVIFEVTASEIVVHNVLFTDAKATYAGRA
jgi:hypothetical protein